MEEDVYVLSPDSDALGDGLHNLALLVPRKLGPAGVKAPGFGEDLVAGQPVDPQHVDGRLGGREFFVDLGKAGFERPVSFSEPGRGNLIREVELIRLVHFLFDGPAFAFEVPYLVLLGRDHAVQGVHLGGDVSIREQEALELGVIDGFEVVGRDANAALPAPVRIRLARRDVHFLVAGGAVREAREQVEGRPAGSLTARPLAFQNSVAAFP